MSSVSQAIMVIQPGASPAYHASVLHQIVASVIHVSWILTSIQHVMIAVLGTQEEAVNSAWMDSLVTHWYVHSLQLYS